ESEHVHVRETNDGTAPNDEAARVAGDTSFSQGRQTPIGSIPKRGTVVRRADARGAALVADITAANHEVTVGGSAASTESTVARASAAPPRGELGERRGETPKASFRGARADVGLAQEEPRQPAEEGENGAPASAASAASPVAIPPTRTREAATVGRVGAEATQSDLQTPRAVTPAPTSERDTARSAARRALQRLLTAEKWPTSAQVAAARLGERGEPESDAQVAGPAFSLAIEAAEVPWDAPRRVVRVTAQAPTRTTAVRPRINVIFLLDTSGSMAAANRLPLVQEAVARVVEALEPQDRVGIVTYAGEAQTMLPSVNAQEQAPIGRVVQSLVAQGQTNGGAGLVEAFALAEAGGSDAGPAVVLWCTDGEFNVGQTSDAALGNLIDEQARRGVRVAIFGFGRSARIDPRLESLAARAQGGSGYVNTSAEAAAVLLAQLQPLLAPVATDARLTVDFNPLRAVQPRGWTQDGQRSIEQTKIFPGETLSLLCDYAPRTAARAIDELLHVRFVNQPVGAAVLPMHETRWDDPGRTFAQASDGFKFAVLGERLGELLQRGAATNKAEWAKLLRLIDQHLPHDAGGYRTELLELGELAQGLVP
ncbi:MAG: VWA domain-containing protein, partial [Candidatus Didemnitutus sp.]|nr:VWA domain-containing protein [Candidatus Didemnitutus sp.]